MSLESWVRAIKEILLSWQFVALVFMMVFYRDLRVVFGSVRGLIERISSIKVWGVEADISYPKIEEVRVEKIEGGKEST